MGEKSLVGCTKPTGRRLLVEGTIILLIFSLFLEVTSIINYLIFVGIWYLLLGLIILWFKNYTYCIYGNEVVVKSALSEKRVKLSDLRDVFISQGPIAKRLGCGSIYIIPNTGKITVLMDIKNPDDFFQKIKNSLS